MNVHFVADLTGFTFMSPSILNVDNEDKEIIYTQSIAGST